MVGSVGTLSFFRTAPNQSILQTLPSLGNSLICATVMPLAAPIGTNRGLDTRALLRIIIAESTIPVVIDAGIGSPSHAAECMEMGADAVLVNTAIATAQDPVAMARAFRLGVEAGRIAYEAKLAPQSHEAVASSPLTAFLFTPEP